MTLILLTLFLQEIPYVDVQGTRYTGFIPDLLEEIAKKQNIEYEFQTVRDGKYGALVGGRWNGMVGEILYNVSESASMTSLKNSASL